MLKNWRVIFGKMKQIRIRLWLYWIVGGGISVALIMWLSSWGTQISQDWVTLQQNPTDATKKKFDASLELVKAIISGSGTVATIGGGFFVLWNIQLTQTRLITERFSKAVEQLGSDKIEVRLGGIYALERIAQDSDRDHWTVMEVLTSFIEGKTVIERVPKDIQAALRVIGGREHRKDSLVRRLNLSYVYLTGATLMSGDNLRKANLVGTDFRKANFFEADLRGALCQNTDFRGAFLVGTDFRKANFFKADLSDAFLQCTFLQRAYFGYADLRNTDFRGAFCWNTNFKGADIYGANFGKPDFDDATSSDTKNLSAKGITPDQIQKAKNWKEARYDPDFRQKLGLPPEKP